MEDSLSRSLKVDVQESDTTLELSYRMHLSNLRNIERFFICTSTLISLFSSYFALTQRNYLWLIPAIAFITYPLYTVLVRSLNKWYITVDRDDVLINSGPLPAGADQLLMRSNIDRIYIREVNSHLNLNARLVDGRVVYLVRNLPYEIGNTIYHHIEDFISAPVDADEDPDYETEFDYELVPA